MSVAIIPMAKQFGWSATISGIVQSAFYYGYTLFQLPSGFLNTRFSGAKVLPVGVGVWSTATAMAPLLGSTITGLCATRAVVGIGEAVAPAASTDMVASIFPVYERSRAVTFIGAASHLGTILGEHCFWIFLRINFRPYAFSHSCSVFWMAFCFLCFWKHRNSLDTVVVTILNSYWASRSKNV